MSARLLLLGALGVSVAMVVAGACAPESATQATVSPTPIRSTAAPATTVPPATPTATASRTVSQTAPVALTSPGSCPTVVGGRAFGQRTLGAIRIAHQPGFDRIVFDFGPTFQGEESGVPPYTLEQAVSFTAPSGQSVPIQGNARFAVRFRNIGPMGGYGGPADLRPDTPLVREVKLVEDFEGTMVWGIGLQMLQCPRVQELGAPDRLVVDLPTAP